VISLPQLVAELAAEAVAVEVKAEGARKIGSEVGAEAARSYAPVQTGALRDSIQVDEDGYSSELSYAGFVEFGTSDTAPQPFIEPSSAVAETVFVTALTAIIGP
jgi:HK97 gp10 family phage protein